MTKILGISAFYHDSAAALIVDGDIQKAAQEERFTRKKHDASFPSSALLFCLSGERNIAGEKTVDVDLQEVDAVVFYDKPLLKFERLLETYLATAPRGFVSFAKAMPIWLKEKLYLKSVLRTELRKLVHQQRAARNNTSVYEEREKEKKPRIPKLLFCEHHESHAAAAYYPSPYDNAAILCLDGVGEWATSSAWLGKSGSITPLFEIQFPHSLGLLYSAFTQYCGFRVNSGEYKLMGLAPYGNPKYVERIKSHLVTINDDGSFSLNMDYFDYAAGKTMTNKRFHDLFDDPANPYDGDIGQKQMDLAKSIQVVTEEIVLAIAQHVHDETGAENLCLAGGVALNCVANGRLLREGPFKNIWIQPAAGDAGSAIGAAMQVWHKYYQHDKVKLKDDKMRGSYLGSTYTNSEIIALCEHKKLPFQRLNETETIVKTGEALNDGKVVGWFQGAMEFGPRALGNRSIIGDPRNTKMQSQMNLKIKQRESFRPFAPAVLADDAEFWFDLKSTSPYMLLVADVNTKHRCQIESEEQEKVSGLGRVNQVRSTLPAITHVDYSARVQTVHKETNPKFHALISQFKSITGVGVVINTSFNVRGEPPVCSPEDAIRCFLATDMDVLVMENVAIYKSDVESSENGKKQIAVAKSVTFDKD